MPMKRKEAQTFLRSFAFETKQARLFWGLSRDELAEYAGLHVNTIGMMERGDRDLNSLSQTRILMALGCDEVQLDFDGLHFSIRSFGPSICNEGLLGLPASEIARGMGADIHTLRLAQGLCLADIARKADLHLNTVWNCELGLVSPTGYSWYRILQALGVSLVKPRKVE